MFNKNGSRPMCIVKVGNDDRPATEEDIADVAQAINYAKDNDIKNVITHHAIEVIELQEDSEIIVAGHNAMDKNQLNLFDNN